MTRRAQCLSDDALPRESAQALLGATVLGVLLFLAVACGVLVPPPGIEPVPPAPGR